MTSKQQNYGISPAKKRLQGDNMFAKKIELESMSLDDLWSLHEKISAILSARIRAEKHELEKRGYSVRAEVPLPVVYDGVKLEIGYRIDLLVDDQVVVEIKAVDGLAPVHEAQIISYLKLSGRSLGLLINFHAAHLKDGIRRFVDGTGWK